MRLIKIFIHIFILLILSLILMGYSCNNKLDSITAQTLENISPEESENLIAQNGGNSDFVILDVRTLTEFNSGHIANAIQIDYYADDFNSQLEKLDKEKGIKRTEISPGLFAMKSLKIVLFLKYLLEPLPD